METWRHLGTTGILVEAKDLGALEQAAWVPVSGLSRLWESFWVGERKEAGSRTGRQPPDKAKGTEPHSTSPEPLLYASLQGTHPLRQAGAQS